MAPSVNPINFRFPFNIEDMADPIAQKAVRYLTSGIVDLNQAIAHIKPQIDSTVSTANKAASTVVSGVASFNSETGAVVYFPNLGTVNDQLGVAAYTTQQSDNGAKIVVGDSSAVAVTLSSTVTAPWFAIIDNDSSTVASLTPASGIVYGEQAIQPGGFGIVFFDGANFWCGATSVMPKTTPAIDSTFFTSYDASTGDFTQAQPSAIQVMNPITAVSVPYTVQATDYQLRCDSGPYNVYLPDATPFQPGRTFGVKNVDSGMVTVVGYAGQLIDYDSTWGIPQWSNLEIRRDVVPGWLIV